MSWPTAIVMASLFAFLTGTVWAFAWGAVKLNATTRKEDDPPR